MMKKVCRVGGKDVGGGGAGRCMCVRAGSSEVRDGGWLKQEMLLLPLTGPAWALCPRRHWAGTNYACLNICHA